MKTFQCVPLRSDYTVIKIPRRFPNLRNIIEILISIGSLSENLVPDPASEIWAWGARNISGKHRLRISTVMLSSHDFSCTVNNEIIRAFSPCDKIT